WLFMAVTTTVTRGSATYLLSLSVMEAASCMGVRPAACTSLRSGREIMPSGRTGNVADNSGSFHTDTRSASSRPMMYVELSTDDGWLTVEVAALSPFAWLASWANSPL